MRIAILSTHSDLSGAPIYSSILGRELHHRGIEVFFVFGTPGPVATKLLDDGFPVFLLHELNSTFTPFRDLWNVKLLYEILKPLDIDIVHLNSSKAGFIGRLACFALGVPCVYTIHGWGFGYGKPIFQTIYSFIIEYSLSFCFTLYLCLYN